MAVMHQINDGHLLPNITTRNCTNSYCFNYEQSNYFFYFKTSFLSVA